MKKRRNPQIAYHNDNVSGHKHTAQLILLIPNYVIMLRTIILSLTKLHSSYTIQLFMLSTINHNLIKTDYVECFSFG